MARDAELDRLHEIQEQAFQDKQAKFNLWKERLSEQQRLYDKKEAARVATDAAKAEMNREYEVLHQNDDVWDEYKRIRDYNNPQIERLKREADSLASNMKMAFQRASDAYNFGDKSAAPGYASEGRMYKEQLESLNSEITSLGAEVKSARLRAEGTGRRDSSAFRRAQERFKAAKEEQDRVQNELNAYAAETKERKAEFQQANSTFLRAQEAFHCRLAMVKAAKDQRKTDEENLMDRANIPYFYRRDCKVKKDIDGTVNFYFGGLGNSDGLGHGHVSMDGMGKVTYNRDAFDKHGAQNYTDYQERLKQYKSQRGWKIQDENDDYIVKVKGDYLFDNPHLGKNPEVERTDFLVFDKEGNHAHVSVGDDEDGLKIWHELQPRRRRSDRYK